MSSLSKTRVKYDHSWFLFGKLKKEFGFQILVSPRITEILRRSLGSFGVPMIHLATAISHMIHPERVQRNAAGVFICEYRSGDL